MSDQSANLAGLFQRLDERFFAPVADLTLLPDWTPPGGRDSGRYLNRKDGSSLEFKQHRSYGPGDDVRRVDWAVYGRTKKLFTRLVEAEHTPELVIAVDHSASMSAGGLDGKFGPALEHALLLAFVALNSDYRVRLVPFGPPEGAETAQSVTLVHPRQILSFARDRMSGWEALGQTDFHGLGEQSLAWRRQGVSLVVVSDFLIDIPDEDLSSSQAVPSWFALENAEDAKAFAQARNSAQSRILASLNRLHAALEPLKTPSVRAILMAVTGAGERNLMAARSVFDLESGFLHRVLFTRASERAYRAARQAHGLALSAMAQDLGLGYVPVIGQNDVNSAQAAEQKREAIRSTILSLGFGPMHREVSGLSDYSAGAEAAGGIA